MDKVIPAKAGDTKRRTFCGFYFVLFDLHRLKQYCIHQKDSLNLFIYFFGRGGRYRAGKVCLSRGGGGGSGVQSLQWGDAPHAATSWVGAYL